MLFVLLTVAGAIFFLASERRGWKTGKWVGKPLASGAFLAAALHHGALDSAFGRWVAAALAFCVAGDLLLIPASTFVLGLASFLVGHLLFAAGFVVRGVAWPVAGAAAAAALVAALVVGRWLLPHVRPALRAPVVAYVAAISAMVALAAGSYARSPAPLVLGGALAFYLSDLSVARNRFVKPAFENRLWGIPLYYAAQLMFAWSFT
jgi:uncharacterized membrane protein YhhN